MKPIIDNMTKIIRVAVILASYNGGKYIGEQIDSILDQKEVEINIFLFDDDSNDNTIKIVEEINDERITIIKKDNGSGSAAKNFLQAIVNLDSYCNFQYDYVAFSDQDDVWLDLKLSKAIECLSESKSELYTSNLTMWDDKTKSKTTLVKSGRQAKYDYLFEGGSAGCTYVLSSSFFEIVKTNVTNINLKNWKYLSHDWLVYFIARKNNFKVYMDNNSYILYRIHENNVHGHMNRLLYKGVMEKIKYVREGWYFDHIAGFDQLLSSSSTEKYIYKMYGKNIFTRIFILARYNFSLMRNVKKYFVFSVLSLIPVNRKYKS